MSSQDIYGKVKKTLPQAISKAVEHGNRLNLFTGQEVSGGGGVARMRGAPEEKVRTGWDGVTYDQFYKEAQADSPTNWGGTYVPSNMDGELRFATLPGTRDETNGGATRVYFIPIDGKPYRKGMSGTDLVAVSYKDALAYAARNGYKVNSTSYGRR